MLTDNGSKTQDGWMLKTALTRPTEDIRDTSLQVRKPPEEVLQMKNIPDI